MSEVKISEVPMLTADEHEIKLNSILYSTEWSSGYNFSREGKGVIEAHRVISVNQSARFFRTRCTKGCETEHSYAKGCSRTKYYGSIDRARAELLEAIENDIVKCAEQVKKVEKTVDHLNSEKIRIKKLAASSVKEPKTVKAGKL